MTRITTPILIAFLIIIGASVIIIGFRGDKPTQPTVAQEQPTYKVLSVTDGDTLHVLIDGKDETVRLIGVDTPETVDPKKPVQCYGPEASSHTKELLQGKQVTLEADPTQGDRDKYGRLLRYVYLEGENINQELLLDGYAREYTYDKPYAQQEAFLGAQSHAQWGKLGLWGKCVSN